jgi:hypothetical protein
MPKQRIYLTDITLHTREFRQTTNYSTAAERGRMYSPLPKDYQTNSGPSASGSGTFTLTFEFPQELQERINRGEVEVMVPKDGLLVYPGRDLVEQYKKDQAAARRQLIHANRGRTWRKE